MSLTNKAKAVAKNIEGKVQKALENMTCDPNYQAEEYNLYAEQKLY